MKTYSEYLAGFFPGIKVQKLSVNAGFSCPNRDGTIGKGGCIYCLNDSFTPGYCLEGDNSVRAQLLRGKDFFARKYPHMKYLAYFQSFTNTHGRDIDALRSLYAQALATDDVVGMVVGTRPDTIPDEVLKMMKEVAGDRPVFIEFGVESAHDEVLRAINRGHTFSQTCDAVTRAVDAGMHVGVHMIAGLPGLDISAKEEALQSMEAICALPIETVKWHQLQVIRGTLLHRLHESGEFSLRIRTVEEYLDICRSLLTYTEEHRPDLVIERFLASAPPALVVAPSWGLKNYEFMHRLNQR